MTAEMFKADETACIVYNTTRKRVYVKQDRDRDVICFGHPSERDAGASCKPVQGQQDDT
jgi:hypothetical protein